MNVLLIGSGGREHALAWKLNQSDKLNDLYISPGNPGTSAYGTNVALDLKSERSVFDFINNNKIELVVVGPEIPLVDGLHDTIASMTNPPTVIGPKASGAILEGSKKFAKEFMIKHNIPTARYKNFTNTNIEEAEDFLSTLQPPYVLKADGLAAGKGVLIIDDKLEAIASLKKIILEKQFGEAGNNVVIEEFLKGIELSVFVLTDGKDYKILPSAKDYKRIGEGDTGLNTGGMGAISPAPSASSKFLAKVEERIIKPTIAGLQKDGIDYQGFIFIGLMDNDGEPYVIEYNVRLGDPETEAILPRIKTDLMTLFEAVKTNTLNDVEVEIDTRPACTIMTVSGGYPESYEKGYPIEGLETISDALLFQAGTKALNGETVTNGGRVLAVTSLQETIQQAMKIAYSNMRKIKYTGQYYRNDIGYEVFEK
ncbi:MAG: phosphoribosylamine--glycine ligase [Patiriisocius sp.]|jgi:phosphoribosylamine--glycine ligase